MKHFKSSEIFVPKELRDAGWAFDEKEQKLIKKDWDKRTKVIMAGISKDMKDERVSCHIHNVECIETETEFYCPECALINTLKGKVSPHANKYKKHGTS